MILAPAALASFSPNLLHDAQVMLQVDFMRRAFLSGTAIALISGIAGYFVIVRRLIFASEMLSHVAFPGALGAVMLGLSPLLGALGLAVAVALGVAALGGRSRTRDVTTGTILTWVLGVGALLLSRYTRGHSASNSAAGVNILFGSLLGISVRTAWLSVSVSAIVVVLLAIIARPLLFASLDPAPASARGVPVRRLDLLFAVLLAVTVSVAVQAVGALLVIALLVAPAAIARRLVLRPFVALLVSALLALLFTWLGLTLAFYLPYPVSFCLTAVVFVSYVGVVVGQRWGSHLGVGRRRASLVGNR